MGRLMYQDGASDVPERGEGLGVVGAGAVREGEHPFRVRPTKPLHDGAFDVSDGASDVSRWCV